MNHRGRGSSFGGKSSQFSKRTDLQIRISSDYEDESEHQASDNDDLIEEESEARDTMHLLRQRKK